MFHTKTFGRTFIIFIFIFLKASAKSTRTSSQQQDFETGNLTITTANYESTSAPDSPGLDKYEKIIAGGTVGGLLVAAIVAVIAVLTYCRKDSGNSGSGGASTRPTCSCENVCCIFGDNAMNNHPMDCSDDMDPEIALVNGSQENTHHRNEADSTATPDEETRLDSSLNGEAIQEESQDTVDAPGNLTVGTINEETQVSEIDILDIVKIFTLAQLKDVYPHLERLEAKDISDILGQDKILQEQTKKILTLWCDRNGNKATRGLLIAAMEECADLEAAAVELLKRQWQQTPKGLRQPVSEVDITDIVGGDLFHLTKINDVYSRLGNLPITKIENIKDETKMQPTQEQAKQLLRLWINRNGKAATRKKMIEAIEQCSDITKPLDKLKAKWAR